MATSIIKLDDTGWQTLNNDTGMKYRRRKGFVTVSINKSYALTSSWQTFATLPTGFRPAVDITFPSYSIMQGVSIAGAIGTNGEIRLRENIGASSQTIPVGATVTYPV